MAASSKRRASAAGRDVPSWGATSLAMARRFSVKVPVLSVQITSTAPSASTALSERHSTFLRARRTLPMARAKVSVGSKPSGTLAMMMPSMNTTFSNKGRPKARP